MKSFLIFFLAAASCTQQKQAAKPVNLKTDTVIEKLQQQQAGKSSHQIIAQYESYLKSLDGTQPNNVKAAILNYEWLFKKTDTTTCDSGYALFNTFYEEVGRQLQNHQSPEEIPAKRKAAFLKQLKQYGFTIKATEGTFVYTNDRDSVNPKFYSYVSATMKKFMLQQHLETNRGRSGGEGSMAVTPEIFAERYIFWQRFLQQHPNFIIKNWVYAYARSYAEDLVFGMENTPLQVDGVISTAYNKIYQLLLDKYGTEKFAACYKKYYEALKNNDTAFVESFKEKFRQGSSDAAYPEAE